MPWGAARGQRPDRGTELRGALPAERLRFAWSRVNRPITGFARGREVDETHQAGIQGVGVLNAGAPGEEVNEAHLLKVELAVAEPQRDAERATCRRSRLVVMLRFAPPWAPLPYRPGNPSPHPL